MAQITGLAVDSRQVKDGYLFAALPGTRVHGGEFIQYALRMGASAILTDMQGARLARDELDASDAALILPKIRARHWRSAPPFGLARSPRRWWR